MAESCFRCSVRVLLLSLALPLAACAADRTAGGPAPTKTLSTEAEQSAAPERKDKKPPAASSKKGNPNRTPTEETSGPPAPAKPPAVGGSGG